MRNVGHFIDRLIFDEELEALHEYFLTRKLKVIEINQLMNYFLMENDVSAALVVTKEKFGLKNKPKTRATNLNH